MSTKDLEKARERFLVEHDVESSVREPIAYSWERSLSLKIRPEHLDLPFVRQPDPDTPLLRAADPVLRQLADGLRDEPVSVILTSADGVVLTRITSSRQLNRTLDAVSLAPGYSYSEEHAGTNGIGTALETHRPTLVRGAEHYADCFGRLACAGVPIRHPLSGAVVGALDLTGWVEDGGPLLMTLVESAAVQIEARLSAQASARETALVSAYMKACRRSPHLGVLALGDDLVLLNRRLRLALDGNDQAGLLEHALDLSAAPRAQRQVVELPSGATVRLSAAAEFDPVGRNRQSTMFYVSLIDEHRRATTSIDTVRVPSGIFGKSTAWRRSCQQIARCVQQRRWVVVCGEPGSGRATALTAAAREHIPIRTRVFAAADLTCGSDNARDLEHELAQAHFSVVLRDVDRLHGQDRAAVTEMVRGCDHRGWIGATTGIDDDASTVLPHVDQAVSVPALRHRIEDLQDLVPHLLRRLGRGSELSLSDAAMRQLGKYSWPGNVTQLQEVLRQATQRQRSGVIDVEHLPPLCRALSRHALTQIEALERDAIIRSLADNKGNKKAAATALGISRATIYRKINEFGIDI